ncbi:hypothetical protein EDD18DRAFT_1355035 [Armillaria luteobubalina]|uniref:Uncharacterized protein n=1 Tax=Armillaria luteobubalina TaxID=153913 RepID=A0AA39Q4H6_9AGAR|nr:hypothetical protein EDD18DRAFT_1355035 [Armillaria luteobubalina]
MATQADIPPVLTDQEKAFLFQYLDANLGFQILSLFAHVINKCRPRQRALVVIVILLHVLITVNIAANWALTSSAFIQNGRNFWTVYSKLDGLNQAAYLETGIAASMSTILSDSYIVWCCWEVLGRRWIVVLLPILSLISATDKVSDLNYLFHIFNFCIVSKIIEIRQEYFGILSTVFGALFFSSTLATTLWCTSLIIIRILIVTGVRQGAGGRVRVYRRFIEVLVESSAIYSIAQIFFLAFFLCNNFGWYYADAITGAAKVCSLYLTPSFLTEHLVWGIAPTLLIGRAAAGHTRPTEDHDEATPMSTLRFQASLRSSRLSQTVTSGFRESDSQRAVLERDIEAQTEQPGDPIASAPANIQ